MTRTRLKSKPDSLRPTTQGVFVAGRWRFKGHPSGLVGLLGPSPSDARKYVLDTNLYIDAIRNSLEEQALAGFLERYAPMAYMSAVVMQELRTGAVTDEQAKVLPDEIFDVFERHNRVEGPSAMAFTDCGRILATLFHHDGKPYKDRPRSLVNDVLIAITCREIALPC